MKAIYTVLAAAVALACVAPSFAQASKAPAFIGPAVGISLMSSKNALSFEPAASGTFESTDSAADLVGSYGFDLGPQWVGTAGLAFGLKTTSFGSLTSGAITSSAVGKQHVTLSFAPGMRVGSDGLVYGKLALHQLSVNYTSTSGFDETKTHQGTGFGLGYAMALNPQMELRGEFESVSYNGETTGTTKAIPKQTTFGVAVLYKF